MRSLTTRVAIAGGLVAVVLVSLVGMTSFVALRQQLLQSLQEAATHAAQVEGHRLAAVLAGVSSDLQSTAANPMIAHALTDTVGRNAYVVPFLKGIRSVQDIPVWVTMTDHRGHPLATSADDAPPGSVLGAARLALRENAAVGRLSDGQVILAAPILYRATGTAEGALVYHFSVADLPVRHPEGELVERLDLALVESERPADGGDAWGVGRHVAPLGNGLFLAVTAHPDEAALSRPQSRLLWTFLLVGGACLTVVVMGSIAIAQLMTRHLRQLETDSARVVATASFSERLRDHGDDEVARLARSFNHVLDRLEAAHRSLADQAARDLQASEERYRLLAEHASDVISRVSPEGVLRYVSPAVTRLLGYAPSDLDGAALCDFVHPDDVPAVAAHLNGGEASVTFRLHRALGDYVWVEASSHRVGSEAGKGDMVVIIRDVARRKEAEDALAEKTEDLERSNAELEQFAYVASHDLREPLRMVTNYLQLIDRRLVEKDEDLTAFMGFAIDGARRMDRLILDLLEFARVGRNRPPFEPVALGDVVGAAAGTFRRAVAEKGGLIEVAGPLPTVEGDRQELERLFQNLIGNAVKYMPPDRAPEVKVWSERVGSEDVVSVADNGIGIAPEHRERIFVIFQRLHARGAYEGTGVGLAICKKVVDRHQGRIWVEDAPGQGSVFKIAFPVRQRVPPLPSICRPAPVPAV